MLKIISFKICPCYQRISALLEALNLPYESEFLDLNNIPRWFVDISPEIEPAIQTDMGDYIAGLNDVLQYIENKYYPLFRDLDTRYKEDNERWLDLSIEQYINQCNTQRSNDLEAMLERGIPFFDGLERMEKRIGQSRFFQGEKLSQVDIAWMPILQRAQIVKDKTGYDYLAEYPKLRQWQKHLMATGIPNKSVPEDFMEVFEEFYLNKTTYIGQLYSSSEEPPKTSSNLCQCTL
ncbi:glutathione S-transferase [Marinifilum breve]|uniref:Glutathione S-transferase n=1 Tax=Marinifilum breve TaxID=2184082 RepID=A0A2V4A0J6_9BACT|nr:glutathione S-transferase family protein [Marinifilum breve]PXY01367.1 glutathione S-transferase [Marinifilum breve]